MKGDCSDGKLTGVLTRRAGETSFEGDAHASYTPWSRALLWRHNAGKTLGRLQRRYLIASRSIR